MVEVNDIVLLSETDNVGMARRYIDKGETVQNEDLPSQVSLTAVDEIPLGFKIAIKDIKKSEAVIKYGEQIGIASCVIFAGQQVHVHNIEGLRGRGDQEVQS